MSVWLRHKAQYATSIDEFLAIYDPADLPNQDDALFGAVSNNNLDLKLSITMRLLNDGASAAYVESGINVLHVLFGRMEARRPEQEAPMVRALIEAGADVNLYSRRYPTPLIMMLDEDHLPGEQSAPFYDVFLDRPELDLTLPVRYQSNRTVRDGLEYMATHTRPFLGERLRLRDQKFGTTS